MKEFSLKSAIDQMNSANQYVLMVVAPNYEARSNAWLEYLDGMNETIAQHNKLLVGKITLQAQTHQNVFLDGLKWHYAERADEFLARYQNQRIARTSATIVYPQGFSSGELRGEIENWAAELAPPFNAIVDISALPRRVILALLDILRQLCLDNLISKLYILYTWADKYPRAGRPANIGSLSMAQDGQRLSQFLQGMQDVRAILITSREGYSGRLLLDSLPSFSRIETYLFMEKNDPLSSYQTVYANFSLLSALEGRSNADLHYYLSMPRGHHLLVDFADQLVSEWNKNKTRHKSRAFVVAPFGPKPIMISSYIAINKINSVLGTTGIVLHSGLQYSDTYSVGIRNTSCFEVEIDELVGKK